MFRVFDTQEKKWIDKDVYLSSNGELFIIRRSLLGMVKLPLELSDYRYVCHKAIDLLDKNGVQVYEGDFIKAQVEEDSSVIGLVAFAQELSAYVILCIDRDEFYTLGKEVCELIEVVGNVFDGYDEVNQNDKQALCEPEA